MAITTKDELIAALGNWLERSDLTDRAADFITLAEAQMNRTLRLRDMETRSTATLTTGDEFFNRPADFLEEKSLTLSDGSTSWELDPKPIEILEAALPATGRPTHYALTGGAIHVYPKPDKTYTATLIYYARIPALSDTQPTNWLLTRAPDAYLYGALSHAAPFLEDDTGTGSAFATFYGAAIGGLKAEQKTKAGRMTSDRPPGHGHHRFNINTGGY